ncbi:MAG TPA: hypothetical protein VF989_10560 [Polyangiaceae bacterium]|jgi:hypothetical protein
MKAKGSVEGTRREPPAARRAKRVHGRGLCALVAFAALVATVAVAREASAQTKFRGFTWDKGMLGGGLRIGSDNLDLGIGALGGYTFPVGAYVGGTFDYFFGDGESVTFGGVTSEVDASLWVLAAEGGYDFGFGRSFVARPLGALGIGHSSVSSCSNAPGGEPCVSASDDEVVFGLGGLALYDTGPVVLAGGFRIFFEYGDVFVFGVSAGGLL